MSQVVKCSRLVHSACRLIPRYSSTVHLNPASAEQSNWNSRNSKYFTGGGAAIGTFFLFGVRAKAKELEDEEEDDEEEEEEEEEDDDEEAMSSAIEESLSEEIEVPTDGNSRFEKWEAVQERFLLLSETQRAQIELRDVTDDELAECDSLYDAGKLTHLEDKLIELNTVSPGNDQVLWRLARLKWVYGKGYQSSQQHKVYHVAHSLACQAAEANPENGNAHRWIAILSFYRAEKEGVKAGVLNLEAMKYHLDRALEINPDDNVSWTLLGNWHFELAEMTSLQRRWSRRFASVDPPAGSYKKALECFQKSDSITPWIQNTYFIAKTYLRMRDREGALAMFRRLSTSVIATGEDYRVKKESHIYIEKLTNPSLSEKVLSLIFEGYQERYRIPFVRMDTETTYNKRTDYGMVVGN